MFEALFTSIWLPDIMLLHKTSLICLNIIFDNTIKVYVIVFFR